MISFSFILVYLASIIISITFLLIFSNYYNKLSDVTFNYILTYDNKYLHGCVIIFQLIIFITVIFIIRYYLLEIQLCCIDEHEKLLLFDTVLTSLLISICMINQQNLVKEIKYFNTLLNN